MDADTPVVVIGVRDEYRNNGIGKKLIDWLIEYAWTHEIPRLSLAVSKDNYALDFYRHQGFEEYADKGSSFIMVRYRRPRPNGSRAAGK